MDFYFLRFGCLLDKTDQWARGQFSPLLEMGFNPAEVHFRRFKHAFNQSLAFGRLRDKQGSDTFRNPLGYLILGGYAGWNTFDSSRQNFTESINLVRKLPYELPNAATRKKSKPA